MSFVIPYLWLVTATISLSILTRKKFEIVLPLTFVLGTFGFYIGGFLGEVSYGLFFCLLMVFAGIPVLLKRKCWNEVKENTITIGFVVFTLFYAYLSLYHRFTAFSTWDEFQHWGPMIKETMRLDAFYSVFESTLQTHKDYPPFISLLQAMWCNLSGGYAEAYCYRALSVFSVSLFLPVFSKLDVKEKKDWLTAVLHCAGILFVNLVGFVLMETFFTTIYIDFMLGLFSAYSLYLVVESEGKYSFFTTFNLGVSLAFLMMVKQMSIAFYAMSLFLFIGYVVIKKEKPTFKQLLAYGFWLIVIPFAVSKSWELYNVKFDLGWQFKISELSITDFLNLVFHQIGEDWQILALNNYKEAIMNRPLITSFVNFTYFPTNAMISLALFGLFMIYTKKWTVSLLVMVTHVIGTIGYAVTMLMLYTYSFGSYEGPILASFERYLNTYLYLGLCFFLMCLFLFNKSISFKRSLSVEIIAVSLVFMLGAVHSLDRLKVKTSYTGYMLDPTLNLIFGQVETTLNEGDSVLIISRYVDDTGQILKYRYPEYSFRIVSIGMPKYEGDPYSVYYTLNAWQSLYSQFDYVYLYDTDHEFYKDYWTPVTDTEMYNLNFYKVKDNGFCLVAPDGNCYE